MPSYQDSVCCHPPVLPACGSQKGFDDFWSDWTDDFKRRSERRGLTFTDNQLKTMVCLDIQVRLQSHEQDLPNFGLDPMTDEEKATVEGLVNIEEAVIREEMDFTVPDLAANVATNLQHCDGSSQE